MKFFIIAVVCFSFGFGVSHYYTVDVVAPKVVKR